MTTKIQDELREKKKELFIESYANCGVIGPACEAADIGRRTYLNWRTADKEFDKNCDLALQEAVDDAELALRERGIQGIEEVVLYKGEPVWKRDPVTGHVMLDDDFNPIPFTIKRVSDRLLEVYTRAHRPQYSERHTLELSGPGGRAIDSAVQVTYVLPEGMTPEDYGAELGTPEKEFDPLED